MTLMSAFSSVGLLLGAMAVLSLLEVLLPLRKRTAWSGRHVAPNLSLTFLTFATNLFLNIPILLGLAFLQARGWGALNVVALHPALEVLFGILILDFAWYVTHVSMHHTPALWRFHAVHHSDPAVDVTTTIRQHPGEGLIRYVFLAVFGFAAGAAPAAFAIYRIWSALHGLFEHANIRLPQWLDTAITFVFSSPNMHKVHHSRDRAFTDTNYTNIFSVWDRMFGTFTPAKAGLTVDYGLDGCDGATQQSTLGLLRMPFQATESPARGARESEGAA